MKLGNLIIIFMSVLICAACQKPQQDNPLPDGKQPSAEQQADVFEMPKEEIPKKPVQKPSAAEQQADDMTVAKVNKSCAIAPDGTRYCSYISYSQKGKMLAWSDGKTVLFFDNKGRKTAKRDCYDFDAKNKTCIQYLEGEDYRYDKRGNIVSIKHCFISGDDGACISYDSPEEETASDEDDNTWTVKIYDKDNELTDVLFCYLANPDGSCAKYYYSGPKSYQRTYEKDSFGRLIKETFCFGGENDEGECEAGKKTVSYTYDKRSRKTETRTCSRFTSSGKCENYDLVKYDTKGNPVQEWTVCRDNNGETECESYTLYSYKYDIDSSILSKREYTCTDKETESCAILNKAQDYTYNNDGKLISAIDCRDIDDQENCTLYGKGKEYLYDESGTLIKELTCLEYQDNTCVKLPQYND